MTDFSVTEHPLPPIPQTPPTHILTPTLFMQQCYFYLSHFATKVDIQIHSCNCYISPLHAADVAGITPSPSKYALGICDKDLHKYPVIPLHTNEYSLALLTWMPQHI